MEIKRLRDRIQTLVVAYTQLQTAHLVGLPMVQPTYLLDISDHEQLIVIQETGLINAYDREFARPHLLAHEISEKRIAHVQLQ